MGRSQRHLREIRGVDSSGQTFADESDDNLPQLPFGIAYLVDEIGAYLQDDDGTYLIG